ncbi:MAG: hypothetical protein L6437_09665 [Kiritimatiellae bacterium]|nr:hypothetical protein [Kiritimatiellia bacterium]
MQGRSWRYAKGGGYVRLMGVVAALLALSVRVDAVNYTWDAGGGADREWSTTNNWNLDIVPTAAEDAYIFGNFTGVVSSAGAVCNLLRMGRPNDAGTLVVTNSGVLTVNTGINVGFYDGTTNVGTGNVYQSAGTLVQAASLEVGSFNYGAGNYYQSGGTLQLSGGMSMAQRVGCVGFYELSGGILTNSGGLNMSPAAGSGNSTFRQTGGTHAMIGSIYIAQVAGATGLYELVAGQLSIGGSSYIGSSGVGTFRQLGGTNSLVGGVDIGSLAGSSGSYELTNGLVEAACMWVGNAGQGVFTQTGGQVHINATANRGLVIGSATTGQGVYNLWGGTFEMDSGNWGGISLGYAGWWGGFVGGDGTLNLGNATGTGTLVVNGSSPCVFRGTNTAKSTLRGWGTLSANSLQQNGRVVADGYGTDRTLDLSGTTFISKNASFTYPSTNGWFAQNHGALRLPDIAYSASYCWGDTTTCWSETVTNQPLVNSVLFAYTGGAGALTGALLATDHGSVSYGLYKPVAVWNFSGPAGFSACALTIRYDDVKAVSLGIQETNLRVRQWVNGTWQNITGSVDTGAKTITANAVSPLSQIAVSTIPRGTVFTGR